MRYSALLALFSLFVPTVVALQPARPPVSQLLTQHAATIADLKSFTTEKVGSIAEEPYSNDVFYLHFCLQEADGGDAAKDALDTCLAWRLGAGQSICESTTQAIAEAAQAGGGWKNQPVLAAAPYSKLISQYLTPTNVVTTVNTAGDLVYCIRAGKVDDNALMSTVTVDQLKEFFLYVKEVNARVSFQRSIDTDRLCTVVTANDLSGVKLIGGSADFRTALSESSKVAATIYPKTINGPTLLVNLPGLLNALVKLFTPLFPESVKARLKFAKLDVLAQTDSLMEVSTTADTPRRKEFLEALDKAIA
jgi:hypothetical protein